MKRYRNILIASTALILLLLVSTTSAQQGDDLAVIVNPQNPVESISSTDLRKVFAGEKLSWSSNLLVFTVVRAPQAYERDFLLNRILRMSESEYQQYWARKLYSGEVSREPLAIFSNGMQLEAIRVEKGGIALIKAQDVRPGVKVIKVDGHLPGTPGYPLKPIK
jgi:hypothetical protein